MISNLSEDTTVKVAVRIRPLNEYEAVQDSSECMDIVPGRHQIRAGDSLYYTFDHVFGTASTQEDIFKECVSELLNGMCGIPTSATSRKC